MPAHKYNPDKAKALLNPIRNIFVPKRKILGDISPQGSEIWADIGCGSGFFTVPMAGLAGKVYAVDISEKMLEMLGQYLSKKKIENVEPVLGEESRIPLDDRSVHGVFLAFVAHELNDPGAYFREISRVLKPGGRLVVVEFTMESKMGPRVQHRVSRDKVDAWATAAGLHSGRTWEWTSSVVGWEWVMSND